MDETKRKKTESARVDEPQRKPYEPPRLIHRGDVRDITLGPSPGVGESGNPTTFRV